MSLLTGHIEQRIPLSTIYLKRMMKFLLHGKLRAYVVGLSLLFTPLMAQSAEQTAVMAGGCFWCMEEAYEKVPGVTKVISGFSGGKTENPTYKTVTGGSTGHFEAVEIHYDDSRINYEGILEVFWQNIDPFDGGGQFCDRGSSYKSAVFYMNDKERAAAEKSLAVLKKKTPKQIVTPVLKFTRFHTAEGYHQDFYKKNPLRYKYYKYGCGRPARLEELREELRS